MCVCVVVALNDIIYTKAFQEKDSSVLVIPRFLVTLNQSGYY